MSSRLTLIRNIGKKAANNLNCYSQSECKFGILLDIRTASPSFSGTHYHPTFIEEYARNESQLAPIVEVEYATLTRGRPKEDSIIKRYEDTIDKTPHSPLVHPLVYLDDHWMFKPMSMETLTEFEDMVSKKELTAVYSLHVRKGRDNVVLKFSYPSTSGRWWLELGRNNIVHNKDLTQLLRVLETINRSIPNVEALAQNSEKSEEV